MDVCRCKANQLTVGMFDHSHGEQFVIPDIMTETQCDALSKHQHADTNKEPSKSILYGNFCPAFHSW